ncbi:MAG: acyltransferase family protein [Hyphomonadaceae bacterium]
MTKIGALEGLRGMAAVLVVVSHLRLDNSIFMQGWVQNSQSLLSVFFVLSGFVVAMGYGEGMRDGRDAGYFTLRRVGRIWPLHITALGALVALELARLALNLAGVIHSERAPFTGPTSLEGLWENLLLVQMWGWQKLFTWNLPAYTLSVIIVCYALFVLVALTLKPLWMRIAAWGVLMAAAAAIFFDFTHAFMEWRGPSVARGVMDFFLGALTCMVWRAAPLRNAWAAAALFFACVAFVFYAANAGPYGWLFPASSLAFAAMIYACAADAGPAAAALRSKPAAWLGEHSVAIYLFHFPILIFMLAGIGVFERFVGHPLVVDVQVPSGEVMEIVRIGPRWMMDILSVALLGVVLAAAAAAHRYIEIPARDFFANLAARRFPRRDEAPEAA